MYTVGKVKIYNIPDLLQVSNILHACGRHMAEKYDLQHWNNPRWKDWLIVLWCALKNHIYLVYEGKVPVATFQTRKVQQSFLFQKLATSPCYSGKGVGSFCMQEIEEMGRTAGCKEIICEVYDKSEHAKTFYEHRGYSVYGTTDTLKYKELKLKKIL